MANKKVAFGRKPGSKDQPVDVDTWVANRDEIVTDAVEKQPEPVAKTTEKMKRLTLDIPESLHRAIKLKATREGVTMADLLRQLLETHYAE